MIHFNEAPFIGTELSYIKRAINEKHICGNGIFTKKCNALLEKYSGSKCFLTHSCTAALEISALLLDIRPGDEVICPSYTFVSTASAFALRGAKVVFVDIRDDTLNIDESAIESAISSKTKAIVPVHYAGVCANMDKIRQTAQRYGLFVCEDAAQALGSTYKGLPAGSLSDLGAYSFHETKNISCGEGGALIINNPAFVDRAEIILEKGTDRSRFLRGQIDKYTWVSLGSSYLPSDMMAAYLYPQLENIERINSQRKMLWDRYYQALLTLKNYAIRLPYCPVECEHNAHMFYLRCPDLQSRTKFISWMKERGIYCVFHYTPLHSSPGGKKYGKAAGNMNITNEVSQTLVRLPLFYGLSQAQQDMVIEKTLEFWRL